MGDSAIDWCDKTWPIVNGCDRVSPECDNCWAAVLLSTRLKRFTQFSGLATYSKATHRGKWTGEIGLDDSETLEQPLRWRQPQRIFVAPYGDFFHEKVPERFRDRAWEVMKEAKQHTFELLTKRPENMPGMVPWMRANDPPWPNVWLGVTAGNQEMADLRIPQLLQVPAALHFVSCEPLLGAVDFTLRGSRIPDWDEDWCYDVLSGREFHSPRDDTPAGTSPRIGWVIGGGESGPNARPCHPDWARGLRDQCAAAGVPFMWKQNGEWGPAGSRGEYCFNPGASIHDLVTMTRVGKKQAGRLLDGVEHLEFPEVT